MPYQDRIFEIEFDFIDHQLRVTCSDGAANILALRPQTVADFYQEVMSALRDLGIDIKIWPMPVEIPNPIRFDQDQTHKSYDAEYANRYWRALVNVYEGFKKVCPRFIGNGSPGAFWVGRFGHSGTRYFRRAAP